MLQQRLQEVNQRAQQYRSQLLEKEREAKGYQLQLVAVAGQLPNGDQAVALEMLPRVDLLMVTSRDIKEAVLVADQATDVTVETLTS